MNDHQVSTASRGQNTILGRFAPGADRVVKDDGYDDVGAIGQGLNGKLGTGVNSLTNNGTTGPWNIWNPIGPSYQATSVDRRSVAVGSAYNEQPQGSAALLTSEYGTWPTNKAGLGARPTESSSPGLPNVSINNSPSPQAVRSKVERSKSPYLTQAALGPIANGAGLSSLDKQNSEYPSNVLADFANTNNRLVGDESTMNVTMDTYPQHSNTGLGPTRESSQTPPTLGVLGYQQSSPQGNGAFGGLINGIGGMKLTGESTFNDKQAFEPFSHQLNNRHSATSFQFAANEYTNGFLNRPTMQQSLSGFGDMPRTERPRPLSEQIFYPNQYDLYGGGMAGPNSPHDPSASFGHQAYFGNGSFGRINRQQSAISSPRSAGFPSQYEDPRAAFPRPQSLNFGNHRTPSYAGPGGDYSAYGRNMPMSPQYPMTPMSPMGPYGSGAGTPRVQRQAEDYTHNLRSSLLEEFRVSSKTNKKYELKDIYNHVVEFSGDQHGSRFIQNKLETANSDEKERVFKEILPNALQLMTDVFGNYVIQKFFEHGNQVQKTKLASNMQSHVLTLSRQMYGCRVVQKALEHILTDQQASLVKELDNHVLACVRDQNGNHVIQKAIERVPAEHIQFIIKAFEGQVQPLATHPYGCRVIQRMLEHCEDDARAGLLKELHSCTFTLVQDQYGNYVTQHVIEHGKPEDKRKIIQLVLDNFLMFSQHKFASNVVEKSIIYGDEEQRQSMVDTVCAKSEGPLAQQPLQVLMRDQYGNYVVQKLLMQVDGRAKQALIDLIKPHVSAIKKYSFAKHITAIEKLCSQPGTPRTAASESSVSSTLAAQTPSSPTVASEAETTTTAGSVKETTAANKVDEAATPTGSA